MIRFRVIDHRPPGDRTVLAFPSLVELKKYCEDRGRHATVAVDFKARTITISSGARVLDRATGSQIDEGEGR